jgi:hypothetical protein
MGARWGPRAPIRAARGTGGVHVPTAEYSVRPWHTPTADPGGRPRRRAPAPPARGSAACRPRRALRGGSATVTLPPWDYLFLAFNDVNFPDLFNSTWIFSLVGLVVTVVLYNVRTRQLRRHQVYVDMYEWILWAGVIFFFLILTYAVFHFYLLFTLISIPIGVGILIWIRFVRFPPLLAAYETQLARSRYYSKLKFAHPEATIRPKRAARSKTARTQRRRH